MKYLITLTLFLLPASALAMTYTPIVGIPGVTGGSFESVINGLYALSIGIAALLAVVKIIIAGVKYMLTDIVTSKGDAIKDIKGAIFGLLIVLGAVLVLFVINPDLTGSKLDLNPVTLPDAAEVGEKPPFTASVKFFGAGDDSVGFNISYISASESAIQKQLFVEYCNEQINNLPVNSPGQVSLMQNSTRCVISGGGNVSVEENVENVKNKCTGGSIVDPEFSKVLYCITPY